MDRPTIHNLVFGVAVTVAAAIAFAKYRLERKTANRVDRLLSSASEQPELASQSTDSTELPDPVERYFDTVIEEGREHVYFARLEQRGEFRIGGQSGSWKPMQATQHYAVEPPGFVWDANIEIFPFISVRVVDAYEQGRGSLRAMVLSAIPVATADTSPEMDEGELLRYLAEAVWFPTALVPSAGVEWESIDDHSARATIDDHGNTASLVFHFDDEGLVERVNTSNRYRQEDQRFESWTGYFRDYQWHSGMCVPTTALVEWNLPSGDLPYWRATLTSIFAE